MRRLIVAGMGIVLAACPVQAAESSRYLDGMRLLYEYAWGLQYASNGPYDILLTAGAEGWIQAKCSIPDAAWGYQVRDFDGDSFPELLVAGSVPNSSGLHLQMYEIINGLVVLQSDIFTEQRAVIPEEGFLKCYSCMTEQEQRLIGYDYYCNGCCISDGVSLSTELFRYDGVILSKVDGYSADGSSIEPEAVAAGCYDHLGVCNVDTAALISGLISGGQYFSSSEVFVELENEIIDYNWESYSQWLGSGKKEPYLLGGAYLRERCWLPDSVVSRTWGRQQIPQRIIQTQEKFHAIVDAADYLYMSYSDEGKITNLYYLLPDAAKTVYQCYDADGKLCYTIPYNNAKGIVDQSLGMGADGLPSNGGYSMVIWDSPYGLCAYEHYYREYYPSYTIAESGEVIEIPADISALKYNLDENSVANIVNSWKLTVPHSQREQ